MKVRTLFLIVVVLFAFCAVGQVRRDAGGKPGTIPKVKLDAKFSALPSPSGKLTLKKHVSIAEVVNAFNARHQLELIVFGAGARKAVSKKTTMTLNQVPAWQAVMRICKESGLGIKPWGGNGVMLTSNLAAPESFAVQGPFLVVLERHEQRGKEFFLKLFYSRDEVCERSTPIKISEVIFRNKNKSGKAASVQMVADDVGYKEWKVKMPGGFPKEGGWSINASIDAVVRTKFTKCRFPANSTGTASNAGVSLSIEKARPVKRRKKTDYAFPYSLTWQTGLSKADNRRIARLAGLGLRGRRIPKKEMEWFAAAKSKMRHIQLVSISPYDSKGKQITPSFYQAEPTPITEMRGTLTTSEKVLRDGLIEFVWADAKAQVIRFEIKVKEEKRIK